jgi:hypothetical protein
VVRLGAEDADMGALHDVPAELAEFATQDWRQEDRVQKQSLLPADRQKYSAGLLIYG